MFRGLRRRNLIATAAIFLALSLPASAHAADFYVDKGGNDSNTCSTPADPCDTIGAASTKANGNGVSGDTIHVAGGSYVETVTLGDGNSLIEDDFNTTDIETQATLTGSPAVQVLTGNAAGTISGFDVIPAGASGNAIALYDSATVTQNTVTGLSSSFSGIYVSGGDPIVSENSITGAGLGGTGVTVDAGSATVSRNTFTGMRQAIQVGGGSPTISQNQISGVSAPGASGAGGGIEVQNATSAAIVGNSISSPDPDPSDFYSAITIADVDPTVGPAVGATLARNTVSGHTNGFRIINAAVSLNSDLSFDNNVGLLGYRDTASPTGSIVATNLTAYDDERPAFGTPADVKLFGIGLTLDSSAVESPIDADSSSACSISFSRGPTTSGTPCQQFQTTAAPGFVDPSAGDYHLAPLSPMIEAGNPAAPVAPNDQDHDGQARAQDGDCQPGAVRDIGADEAGPRVAECDPPETTIDSGPSGTTANASPSFAFSSDEPGSSFQCRVDAAGFAPCSGPGDSHTTGPLGDGPHTSEVRAIDQVGNVDPSPAVREFVIDTRPPGAADLDPPETTLTKKPRKRVETDDERVKAKFAFSSDEPGSSFDCKLDKRAFKPCDAGRLKRKVGAGRHKFIVVATDAAGNVDPTPARVRWKVVAG